MNIPVYPGLFQLLRSASPRGCRVWSECWTHLRCLVQTCQSLMASVGHILEKPKNEGREDTSVSVSEKMFNIITTLWKLLISAWTQILTVIKSELLVAGLNSWKAGCQQSKAAWTPNWARAKSFLCRIHIHFDPTKVVVCLHHWHFCLGKTLLSIHPQLLSCSVIWDRKLYRANVELMFSISAQVSFSRKFQIGSKKRKRKKRQ